MPAHTLLLSDTEEAALLFLTEQHNLTAPPPLPGTDPAPPWSPDDMLYRLVQMPLASAQQQVIAVVVPLEELLGDTPPEQQAAMIAKVRSPAAQMMLRARLAQP